VVKHAVPAVVKVSERPVGFVYHRIPGNAGKVRAVPVFRGMNVRDFKRELDRVRRGRDIWGRR
jgi:hypothetical protein